jgi:Glutathione S-transferase, N-terminal domain
LYGFKLLKDLYLKADPEYEGRHTVPVLWDKKTETIVNNESSKIIRMFYTEFDGLLLPEMRRPGGGLYPEHLRPEIDAMNEWVYATINNGVCKTGFATAPDAYDANVYPLFASLDGGPRRRAPGPAGPPALSLRRAHHRPRGRRQAVHHPRARSSYISFEQIWISQCPQYYYLCCCHFLWITFPYCYVLAFCTL